MSPKELATELIRVREQSHRLEARESELLPIFTTIVSRVRKNK